MSFVIGDYEYTVSSSTNRTVSAKVVDTTKTSYAAIPQTVTNNGVEYTVKRLGSCFKDCASMVAPPSIPSTVTYMYQCFYGCSSLVQAPTIPATVTEMYGCFWNCSSLVNPPVIPNSVTSMGSCFWGCSSLVSAPSIPSGVTNMGLCFSGCSSLTSAPAIPSGVTTLESCFSNCSSIVNPPAIPSSVTNMLHCFRACASLVCGPEIPYGVTEMYGCFENCGSLVSAHDIPNSVTRMSRCFFNCYSLVEPPVLSNSITNLDQCFSHCRSMISAPAIPSSVTELTRVGYTGCFEGCISLVSAPAIPANVTYMNNVFKGCASLTGSIVVTNSPTKYGNLFKSTRNPIYIVTSGSADQTTWRAIADQYDNVIFMVDANSKPALAYSVKRVASSGSTTEDPEGEYAYVSASATAYMDSLPDGYTNDVEGLTLTVNGTAVTPTWSEGTHVPGDAKVTAPFEAWLSITQVRQVFAMKAVDSYGSESPTITVVLPSTGVLVDLYAGGEGLAIGRRATGTGLAVAMDADFEAAVKANGEACHPLFIWSTAPTSSSTFPVSPCFVYCTADNGLYYCTT